VLALLLDAPLRIETTEGTKVLVAVHGGFFSVDSDQVNVIAETAELAEEIDVERAKAALERAKAAASDDDPAVQAAKRAETRLAVAVGTR
jgi:F-type H+-transporting ATPase subunit epsilon